MTDPSAGQSLKIDAIRASVPIQYPMLMIDRVCKRSPGACTVIKNLTITEPCFVGHFPGRAIFPGSMLVETMAQAGFFIGPTGDEAQDGGTPAAGADAPPTGDIFLLSVEIKFLKPAVPGDQIVIEAKLVQDTGRTRRFRAVASVDDEPIAKGMFLVTFGGAR